MRRLPIQFLIAVSVILLGWSQRDVLRGFLGGDSPLQEPLMVGTNVWPGYEPLYLARNLGFYEKRIRMVEYSSATEVIRALRNRLIDVGALTLDEALLLRQSGVDVRVVLVTDISDGGDVILAKPEIESLMGLKGRRVGVESTALGAYVLTRALQTVGLTNADVDVVQVEVDEHAAAYRTGRVDAVVTFEPVQSQLLKTGARPVFDSSQLPGEIVDVVVARGDIVAAKGDSIQHLINGWFKALAHLKDDSSDAAKRMATRLNLSPGEALDSFNGLKLPSAAENLQMFDQENEGALHGTVEKLAAVMKAANLLEGAVDHSALVVPEFVQELVP